MDHTCKVGLFVPGVSFFLVATDEEFARPPVADHRSLTDEESQRAMGEHCRVLVLSPSPFELARSHLGF